MIKINIDVFFWLFQCLVVQACKFVEVIEKLQGLIIGSIGTTAFEMGYINKEQFKSLAQSLLKSRYVKNLLGLPNRKE